MIVPINTSLGELHGRDAIYLDEEKYNKNTNELKLTGEINGDLCTKKVNKEFIYYEIIFNSVTDWAKIELDKYFVLNRHNSHDTSSFYEISKEGICLYVFQTYDWVYEVQCNSFEIGFGDYT